MKSNYEILLPIHHYVCRSDVFFSPSRHWTLSFRSVWKLCLNFYVLIIRYVLQINMKNSKFKTRWNCITWIKMNLNSTVDMTSSWYIDACKKKWKIINDLRLYKDYNIWQKFNWIQIIDDVMILDIWPFWIVVQGIMILDIWPF